MAIRSLGLAQRHHNQSPSEIQTAKIPPKSISSPEHCSLADPIQSQSYLIVNPADDMCNIGKDGWDPFFPAPNAPRCYARLVKSDQGRLRMWVRSVI